MAPDDCIQPSSLLPDIVCQMSSMRAKKITSELNSSDFTTTLISSANIQSTKPKGKFHFLTHSDESAAVLDVTQPNRLT